MLVTSVKRVNDILFGKFSLTITQERKNVEWAQIADTVSAVSGMPGSAEAT